MPRHVQSEAAAEGRRARRMEPKALSAGSFFDKLLCICIGMDATLDEIQTLLHQCGFSQLYAHNKRDAILMYGILHQLPLEKINDTLFQEEAETIF